jgi:hypothetical protein
MGTVRRPTARRTSWGSAVRKATADRTAAGGDALRCCTKRLAIPVCDGPPGSTPMIMEGIGPELRGPAAYRTRRLLPRIIKRLPQCEAKPCSQQGCVPIGNPGCCHRWSAPPALGERSPTDPSCNDCWPWYRPPTCSRGGGFKRRRQSDPPPGCAPRRAHAEACQPKSQHHPIMLLHHGEDWPRCRPPKHYASRLRVQ